jgi:hypothetical protein
MRNTFDDKVDAVYQSCGEVEPEVIPVPLAAEVSSHGTMLGAVATLALSEL